MGKMRPAQQLKNSKLNWEISGQNCRKLLLNPMIRKERTEDEGGTYMSQLEINLNSLETSKLPWKQLEGMINSILKQMLSTPNVTRSLLWGSSESPAWNVSPVFSSHCPIVLCLFWESLFSLACMQERAEFDWRERKSLRSNYLSQYRSLRKKWRNGEQAGG